MLTAFFSVAPFFFSLIWCIFYVLQWRQNTPAQHVLTGFAAVCTLLYACHALFFLGGQSEVCEWVWMTCSLAVYPLYFLYILRLTSSRVRVLWPAVCLLIPAIVLPAAEYFFPAINAWHLRQIAMAAIVVYVCVAGVAALNRFEREIHDFYADTDDKSTYSIRTLLICFTVCSVCSVVFSTIGRDVFRQSVLLVVPSVLFSVLLFSVFYLGSLYRFSAAEMHAAEDEHPLPEHADPDNVSHWVPELERLMLEERIYLEPNLKIADLALRVGTCRTYISNYINQQKGMSFSDYINEQRIRYAEQLLRSDAHLTIEYLTAATGFASEQSFVRNFRKFSTMTLHK